MFGGRLKELDGFRKCDMITKGVMTEMTGDTYLENKILVHRPYRIRIKGEDDDVRIWVPKFTWTCPWIGDPWSVGLASGGLASGGRSGGASGSACGSASGDGHGT